MPQTFKMSTSGSRNGNGGGGGNGNDNGIGSGTNTFPRAAAKRLSTVNKSSIPRFKRPVPPHSIRPHSAVLSTSVLHHSKQQQQQQHQNHHHLQQRHNEKNNTTIIGSVDDLATPRASTFNLAIGGGGSGSMSNGTNTAVPSMSSSVVMDTETRESSPSEQAESRDMVTEMQRRCRIGPSGYPHLNKAKRLRFYRNGDQYFKGISYALQCDRVKSMQPLMEDLMKTVICDSTALPHGIRHIFTIDGSQKITSIEQFDDGGSYVCSSTDGFKQVDYSRAGEPSWRLTLANRNNRHLETKQLALNVVEPSNERTDFVYPKIIKVIRNGVKPRRIIRHLLNKKTARSYDHVLSELSTCVKLDSGAIRKIFALSGRQVLCLEDFFGDDDVFVAYGGNEKMAADDLLVVTEEDKRVAGVTILSRGFGMRRRRMPNRNESLRMDRSSSVIPDQDAQRLPYELSEQYALNRLIGDGNTAVVYEVTNKETNEKRAMKVVAKENVFGKEHLIEAELSILRRIEHHFIVQLFDSWYIEDAYYLSLELIEMGDLFEHLKKVKRVAEREAVRMITCLGQALEYIHDKNIVHRDVKLENLLIMKDAYGEIGVKLADFGLATEMPSDFQPLMTICGTPTYVAPEVLLQVGYGTKVDLWASGVILYAILVGFPPFQGSDTSEQELFAAIQSGEFSFPSPQWDEISWSVRHLIMGLITLDPFERISATEMLRNDWVESLGDVDEDYEEWAKLFVATKMRITSDVGETQYEYFASRRTSMDELSETAGREFSFSRGYS